MANNFQPIGSEIQVNTLPFGDQRDADVAALTDGRFFVAYTYAWSGTDHDIYGQFVNGDGTLSGPFVAINYDGPDNLGALQTLPAVAPRLDGGAVVVYNDNDLGGSAGFDISLNVISPSGVVGPLLTLADFGPFQVLNPDAALLANGQVVVAFEDVLSGTDRDIWLRVLNADGSTFATFGSVEVDDSINTIHQRPAIAAFGNHALVAYEDADSDDILAKIYDGNTGTVGGLITVATAGTLNGVDVAALADGRFIVVWDNDDTDDIEGRFLDATGAPVGPVFIIADVGGNNDDARVAALPDGGFVVTWENNGGVIAPELNDGDNAVLGRRFDATGAPAGDLFLVNTGDPATGQANPTVAVNAAGQAFIAWDDDHAYGGPGEDPDPTGVRGHAFLAATDIVNGTPGGDAIETYSLGETINGLGGDDTINGLGGNDVVSAGAGFDRILGGDGDDRLFGQGGVDLIKGEAGRDLLVGGRGGDVLIGGLAKDYFDFNSIRDSRPGVGRDFIKGFSHAEHDKIDLKTIDADTTIAGNQSFHLIGAEAFHDVAGELRFAGGLLQGDINGDGLADIEVRVTGLGAAVHGDFVL